MTTDSVLDCPHIFTEGDGSPMFLDGRYWCQGHINLGISWFRRRCSEDCCLYDMGEWGAWRAVVAPYSQSLADVLDSDDPLAANIACVFMAFWADDDFGAVGWSP
jgi:endogenous inhibitor of DNA gyrase (YacG/DUF329 family)